MSTRTHTGPRAQARSGASRQRLFQTRSEAPRRAANDDGLDRYLGELQHLELLTATEERACGHALERTSIDHWRKLLSFRRALPLIAQAAEPAAPGSTAALLGWQRRLRGPRPSAAELSQLAERLHALDTQRQALAAADTAVHGAVAGDAAAQRYLTRVRHARLARDAARNRFVAANLRLVIAMAKRYPRGSLSLSDLIQEGNLGLMRAVDLYDFRRGLRFSTYASWWIRHTLNRAISEKSRLVRIPVHALDDAARFERQAQHMTARSGLRPSTDELAAAMNQPAAKVARLQEQALLERPLSLDSSERDGKHGLHETLPDDATQDPVDSLRLARFASELPELLEVLTPIEGSIVRSRFGLSNEQEQTLRQIGARYDLSRERIRQIERDALRKLGTALRRRHPDDDGGLQAA